MTWMNWLFIAMAFTVVSKPNLSWSSVENSNKIQIGFISKESPQFFEDKVKPYWGQLGLHKAVQVELVNLTPFDSKGNIKVEELAERIRKAPSQMKAFYIHWNEKYTEQHEAWIKALQNQTEKGARVAFFAGLAKPGMRTVPLRQTLAAQVPKALILGELMERERLPAQHFYGPELFSAFQDSSAKAQGLSPLHFVSRWAAYKPDLNLNQSLEELRKKKFKSSKMWPTAEDFFGR